MSFDITNIGIWGNNMERGQLGGMPFSNGWGGQETSVQVSPIPPERKDPITVAVAGNLQQANLG